MARSVEDVEGPWIETEFNSGLIERCRTYWTSSIDQIPNVVLATFLSQKLALSIAVPEAEKRLSKEHDDDTELFDGQLRESLQIAKGSQN